ncbi:choice-of-anchor I family protein [Oceanidesulfovibrio marinus]|uniref:Alkaline phosphatase n=1 Tax=Oceanidesulfovibrio marinus TaxID=370038 RepID=A0A6P1ZE70_9BACT|nr:choice-of-anchor I family protein [Oceanidesulfovibrio marinus]TVM32844.1 alkaline phosphatase [Oceanidesulfovibrio marinus]
MLRHSLGQAMAFAFMLLSFAAPAAAADYDAPEPSNALKLELLGRHTAPEIEGAAEIASYDPATKRLFVVNSNQVTVDVLDIADPKNPNKIAALDLKKFGGVANSVSVHGGVVAVAVEAFDKQDPGAVHIFKTNGEFDAPLTSVPVGSLPDMVTFTPDGKYIVVACEGEPDDQYATDPEGSVWVIDMQQGPAKATGRMASFQGFNLSKDELQKAGVRIFGPHSTVAQDLEPEYIAVTPDSARAYVALQENNAVAIVDIAKAEVEEILPLGFKDFSKPGNSLDPSNKDGGIHFGTYDNLYGMYQPDSIALATIGDTLYLVTANEGDSRDYDGWSEEERVAKVQLDPEAFPNAEEIQKNEALGRLKITKTLGDTDGDGDFDELYSFGARSFAIWKVEDHKITLVYDSGDQIERITAAMLPDYFNSTDDENNTFDDRSDDKGPEPEALAVGEVGGRSYAFIGLERIGGVMVYDITNPESPVFVTYRNDRDFSGVVPEGTAGDLAPECIDFIPADQSPNGKDIIAVANEVSGTTTLYEIVQ